MNDQLSQKDLDDLEWEIEAAKSWDAYFAEYGFDRDAIVRAELDYLLPWYVKLWRWIRGIFS